MNTKKLTIWAATLSLLASAALAMDKVPESNEAKLSLKTTEEKAVHGLIEDLILAGTTFDTEALDRIYHDSMLVTMIDLENNVMKASKSDFVALFEKLRSSGTPPLNTWAIYNDLRVQGNKANVLITRKVNLTGQDQILVLNIDLVKDNNRWQVTREMIFARPDTNTL